MEVIRSVFRHKLRTVFTIIGIVVGIFALTVMGAMAEKINLMIDDAINYTTGQITVTPKGGTGFLSSIPPKVIKKINKIDGVEDTMLKLTMMLESENGEIQMRMPNLIYGYDVQSKFVNTNQGDITLKSGRNLKKGDNYKVVVGADIARSKKLKIGDKMKIRKKYFKVIGITQKNTTATDTMVFVPLHNAQRLYVDADTYLKDFKKRADEARDIPKTVLAKMDPVSRKQIKDISLFKENEISNYVSVSWKKGADPEKVSREIKKKVKDVMVTSPKDAKEQLSQALTILNLVIIGSALISVVVGGLSVINTMIMAVHERTREIGVKKALGAKTYHVLAEYITEAAVLGLLGGLIGLGFGSLIVKVINAQTLKTGVQIFEVTPRLAAIAIIFSSTLGAIAGIYPAVHAARLNPVEALRYE